MFSGDIKKGVLTCTIMLNINPGAFLRTAMNRSLFTQFFTIIEQQPPRGIPRKSCSENMQQIYRRTPMCSPVNLFHIFGTPFPKNTSGLLILIIGV